MSLSIERIAGLEGIIGYSFKDKKLLVNAMVHRSYSAEAKIKTDSYERLEFLGDSVLQLFISEFLFKNLDLTEGELSKLRAGIVSEAPLACAARKLGLGEYILLGRGAEMGGIRDKDSVLADVFEAVSAAVYLDGGTESVSRFLSDVLKDNIESSLDGNGIKDYKSALQEEYQKNGAVSILYECYEESGKDHEKVFRVRVSVNGTVLGDGQGRTKKEAEQNAARDALDKKD